MATTTVSRRGFLRRSAAALAGLAWGWRWAPAQAGRRKRVDVLCRSAWGAKPYGKLVKHRIRRITVHHSAVALPDNRKAPARFRSHQAAHQANGWPDIAYHLLIDRNGNVYRGRPPWARGDTATNYDPTGHLLILCEGDFEREEPSRDQVRALVQVLAWACERYGVPRRRIRTHRQYAATSCPGRALQALFDARKIRPRVRRRLERGGVRLERLCGDEGRARILAIEAGRA